MNNKKRSFFSAVLLSFFLLALVISPAAAEAAAKTAKGAEQVQMRVMDEADLLSAQEKNSLENTLVDLEKKHKVHIAVYTSKDLKGQKAGDAANKLVDKIAPGAENGAMALVLDMKERDWYIATDTKMRERITDKVGQGHLSDKFLPALSQNRYAEAFGAYAATADEMLTYYEKEGKPFDPKAGFSLLALGIAVVLAGVIFWLVRSSLIGSMSNVTAATEADAYLNQESFNLTENRDTFLYMNVTRREKPKKKETSSSRDESHGGGGGKF